jgi:uncharacterized membrane protein
MTLLVAGLVLFLGAHSVRIFADDWRTGTIARTGAARWKAVYSLVSLAGLVLVVWGYGAAREAPVAVFAPPVWARHLASLLTLPAFVLLAAAKGPANGIRAAVGHPMVLGVKLWAFAHLLANGTLADVVLFGSFLAWAIADYAAARRRDRAEGTVRARGTTAATLAALVIGVAAWALFAFVLHGPLIGVRPFG